MRFTRHLHHIHWNFIFLSKVLSWTWSPKFFYAYGAKVIGLTPTEDARRDIKVGLDWVYRWDLPRGVGKANCYTSVLKTSVA